VRSVDSKKSFLRTLSLVSLLHILKMADLWGVALGGMILKKIGAIILDLDGVVTDTRSAHGEAWKKMFDEFLQSEQQKPFSIEFDYEKYVDGKPRLDGVRSFLESRKIDLTEGEEGDSAEKRTIHGLAEKKNQLFQKILKEKGPKVFQDSVEEIKEWKEQGIPVAIVSSSRNASLVLKKAGIQKLFDAQVDGDVGEELGLQGKPAPDYFLEATRRLGYSAADCVVVEDAQSGIEAGRAGGFKEVVGITRSPAINNEKALKEAGADRVVSSLRDLDVFREREVKTKHLFKDWRSLLGEVSGSELVLFLDYDGTLTPIVNDPKEAILSDQMREELRNTAKGFKTLVISGRDRRDVKQKVGLDEIFYAGSHGFDISGPGGFHFEVEEAREMIPLLDEQERYLQEKLKKISGVEIERKKYSIAIHYRNVEQRLVGDVEEAIDEIVQREKKLKKGLGKKVYEIRPNLDWGKGKAIRLLSQVLGVDQPNAIPFFIGDDKTDEDGFQELKGWGIGVRVIDEENEGVDSRAEYFLNGTEEVYEFLKKLNHEFGQEEKQWRHGA
jgi:trehalose 6-phosphate phosphatase